MTTMKDICRKGCITNMGCMGAKNRNYLKVTSRIIYLLKGRFIMITHYIWNTQGAFNISLRLKNTKEMGRGSLSSRTEISIKEVSLTMWLRGEVSYSRKLVNTKDSSRTVWNTGKVVRRIKRAYLKAFLILEKNFKESKHIRMEMCTLGGSLMEKEKGEDY